MITWSVLRTAGQSPASTRGKSGTRGQRRRGAGNDTAESSLEVRFMCSEEIFMRSERYFFN